MRWSPIQEHHDRLTIHCWCLSDACQLVQQHGQPYHSKWNVLHDKTDHDQKEAQQRQGVSRQAAADRRSSSGTHIISGTISVSIPSVGPNIPYSTYTDRWGAPPAEQLLSPQAWSDLLGEMSRQWKVKAESLKIKLNESCKVSVKSLLDALIQKETEHHLKELLLKKEGGWGDVEVELGAIDGSELIEWMTCHTQQYAIRLTLSCNILPDSNGCSPQVQKAAKINLDYELK